MRAARGPTLPSLTAERVSLPTEAAGMSPVHACGTLEPVPPSPPAALGVALIHAVNSRERCLAALCMESCAIVASCSRCLSGYLGKHPLLYPPWAASGGWVGEGALGSAGLILAPSGPR